MTLSQEIIAQFQNNTFQASVCYLANDNDDDKMNSTNQ